MSIGCMRLFQDEVRAARGGDGGEGGEPGSEDVVQPEPLDMAFPRSGFQKQITYLLLFPLIFPLWLTLPDTRGARGKLPYCHTNRTYYNSQGVSVEEDEEENQPLDLSWPDTCRERITYLLFLPIIIPLWITLPDTRKASG